MFYHVIACDSKILIYKVNSPYNKKYVNSLELFVVFFFANNLLICIKVPSLIFNINGVSQVNYLRKITRNSSNEYTFFFEENLPYK